MSINGQADLQRDGSESAVAARLDRLPGSRYLWTLVALLSFGAFFEIYDIGLTAPLSLGLLKVHIFVLGAKGLFGLADQASFIAATFAGLFLGTMGFSAVADRFGRRAIFTGSLLWYSVATMIMGLQNTAVMIDVWRLIAGVGIGMELVAIDCYIAELMPKAIRGRAFTYSTSIQFLSAPTVAIFSLLLIPHTVLGLQGWRWLCFFPGAGALLIWWVRRGIPESPRWLASHGRQAQADRVTSNIEARVAGDLGRPLAPPVVTLHVAQPAGQGRFADLWAPAVRRRTITMIVFHVFQAIGYFGFGNWLPTLLVEKGVTITRTLTYGAAIAVAMPLAPLAFALFADRFERKWQIVIGAVSVSAFGLLFATMTASSPPAGLIGLGLAITVANSLMSYAFHTYQSEIFPNLIRARAVGFVYSFSRLSAMFSGYLIAMVLARAGPTGVLIFISAAMMVVSLTIAVGGPRTRGLSVEEIGAAGPR